MGRPLSSAGLRAGLFPSSEKAFLVLCACCVTVLAVVLASQGKPGGDDGGLDGGIGSSENMACSSKGGLERMVDDDCGNAAMLSLVII